VPTTARKDYEKKHIVHRVPRDHLLGPLIVDCLLQRRSSFTEVVGELHRLEAELDRRRQMNDVVGATAALYPLSASLERSGSSSAAGYPESREENIELAKLVLRT